MSKRMYHPCHKLSVPSAKLFWCRHCMQMFEDAISRWKHSRICHSVRGYKHKSTNSKVIQMYVKPDVVSYTSNVSPGQGVYHRPVVKQTSADLVCLICHTKFENIHDMRKHVINPCQRGSDLSVNSFLHQSVGLGRNDNQIGSIRIERVETSEDDLATANTSLSVLAEASKHVESLALGVGVIEETTNVEQCVAEYCQETFTVDNCDTSSQAVVLSTELGELLVRTDLERLVLLLEGDRSLPTEEVFTADVLHNCLLETAQCLQPGQVIQAELQCCNRAVHQFVVGLDLKPIPYHSVEVPEADSEGVENSQTVIVENAEQLSEINTAQNSAYYQQQNFQFGVEDLYSKIEGNVHSNENCVNLVANQVSSCKNLIFGEQIPVNQSGSCDLLVDKTCGQKVGSKLQEILTLPIECIHFVPVVSSTASLVVSTSLVPDSTAFTQSELQTVVNTSHTTIIP